MRAATQLCSLSEWHSAMVMSRTLPAVLLPEPAEREVVLLQQTKHVAR
jgi:hypothetical protein